ncbi:arsenic transporter [Parafilimonas sp.]|uniref:arsenic transporter n=1 Tax=Parafilimonas sp. TaxID=1969739 RepID=UPI0039E6D5E5
MNHNEAIWIITIVTTACVIIRPFKLNEAIWVVCGAFVLLVTQLISFQEAINGVAKGADVYLFLTGMMLLAETAREEKLFDWLAALATKYANGSAKKLFVMIYLVGTAVTVFLSNDATAVVLTPAVAAAMKTAKVKQPLPYLFICAFIANAASFVLPISNPANLVIYGKHLPALLDWAGHFILPSLLSIAVTYIMLYKSQRKFLDQSIETDIRVPRLARGGRAAALGIGATAIVLLTASAFDVPLGLPTAVTGIITSLVVVLIARQSPLNVIKGISWSVLPLVAGLFLIVEALIKTGLIESISNRLAYYAATSPDLTAIVSGAGIGIATNLTNNLPAGLIAGGILHPACMPDIIKNAVLIGIDLGPNLSVTGSLATILWLVALRREGHDIHAWRFIKIGVMVMIPALLLALAALWM